MKFLLERNKMRIGIVSGYFNPIHTGHLDYIEAAKKKCDQLWVIVNSDEQVKVKGSTPFMDQDSRLRIVQALKAVDYAIIADDVDGTVCKTLERVYTSISFQAPFIDSIAFMNGGDRKSDIPEQGMCDQLGIDMIFNVGGEKTESSSNLIEKVSKN